MTYGTFPHLDLGKGCKSLKTLNKKRVAEDVAIL
jgi:hypothetical protein